FFDLGKYADAIKEFEAAYEAKNDPAFLYNLAQAHRLAGNPEQALRFYRTYLRKNPKPPNRADIEDKISQLEKLVDQKTATQTSPPTQTMQPTLPGTTPPTSGLQPAPPASPSAGTATAPPTTPAPPAAPPPSPPVGASPTPPMITTTPSPPAVERQDGSGLRLTAYILGGVGVASIVVGALFGQGAKDAAQQIKTAADNSMMYTTDLESVDQRGRRDETLEFTFIGIGAAALAGGAVCFILGGHRDSETAAAGRVSFLPSLTAHAGSAALRVSF
ncbi:MAG TPA: tetratricopeptide repeat protein, partial [Polyangia bacterium]|nr:tetratricopeptide repeat protein [Polyangia bacterium]